MGQSLELLRKGIPSFFQSSPYCDPAQWPGSSGREGTRPFTLAKQDVVCSILPTAEDAGGTQKSSFLDEEVTGGWAQCPGTRRRKGRGKYSNNEGGLPFYMTKTLNYSMSGRPACKSMTYVAAGYGGSVPPCNSFLHLELELSMCVLETRTAAVHVNLWE